MEMVETQISVPETIARLYSESEAEVVREVFTSFTDDFVLRLLALYVKSLSQNLQRKKIICEKL